MELPEFNPTALGLSIFFWALEIALMKYSGTFKVLPWYNSMFIVVLSLPAIYFMANWQLNK